MTNAYLEKRFCVYLHKDRDGIIRYVGHGTPDRPYIFTNAHRNKKWLEMFKENPPEVCIVSDGLSKHEALDLEIELFHKYRDTILNKHCPSKVSELDFDTFNEWFYIDEDCPSGLRWKKRPPRTNKHEVGTQAGSILTKEGGKQYWQIKLKFKVYKVHRVIYLLKHGSICSDSLIDHIDGNGLNNKLDNLRLVNFKQNCVNKKTKSKIGYSNLGVSKIGDVISSYRVRWFCKETGKRMNVEFNCLKHNGQEQALQKVLEFRSKLVATGEIATFDELLGELLVLENRLKEN